MEESLLNNNDKQRIEQKARKSVFADGQYDGFIAGAEYATIYEREQQAKKIERMEKELQGQEEIYKFKFKQLEAERSEVRNKVIEEAIDIVTDYQDYNPLILERLNSLKTK